MFDPFAHIKANPSRVPPERMRAAARDGLERHERGESGDGLKPETVSRANRIADGEELTEDHVREMAAWFARHNETRPEGDPEGSPWFAAWQLWGGDAGAEWSQRIVEQLDADKALSTQAMEDGGALVEDEKACGAKPVKSFYPVDPDNPYIIRKRGIVYGGSDLVGDTFTPETDIGRGRTFVGMPVYYDHTQSGIKSQIGQVVGIEDDDEGITFVVELDRNHRYIEDILRLEREQALGASTGAPGHLVRRKAGVLKRWIVSELSLTPTPAEPRTLDSMKSMEDAMADTANTQTTQAGADIAQLAESVTALTATVQSVRSDLDEIRSMPAVKGRTAVEAATELGGAIGGGLNARADEDVGIARYAYMKSISRPGAPARADEYPEGVFGGFCKALFYAQTNINKSRDARKALTEAYGSDPESPAAKALGTQAGVSGAYMIPEQFIPTLMRIAAQSDVLYGRTMVIPADGGEIVIPALNHSGAWVDGQSTYFGGVTVTWGDDDAAATETQPSFKQIRLKTNAMKARTRVKNSLMMRSAITIDSVVSQLLGAAIGRARDYALMRGTGAGQPLGVLNAPATIDVAGSAIDFATLAGMENQVIPERDENYIWVVHTKSRGAVYALQQTNNTLVTFLPDLRGKPQAVLLGRNIAWTDKVPYLSNDVSNRVSLIDPSMIVCAEFQGIAIAVSDQVRFEDDETVFRAILSMDAQPWISSKVEIASGEYVSGFVTI